MAQQGSGYQARYKRILLKLSGEALMGSEEFGIDPKVLDRMALEVGQLVGIGVQVGLVIGGGRGQWYENRRDSPGAEFGRRHRAGAVCGGTAADLPARAAGACQGLAQALRPVQRLRPAGLFRAGQLVPERLRAGLPGSRWRQGRQGPRRRQGQQWPGQRPGQGPW